MLAIQHLRVSYGITQVLRDVTFEVPAGKIVALLGGNGSGKTTMLNTLSGLVRCSRGSILFEGQECTGLSADSVVRRGIAQVPQGREVWPSMSVQDNLELGAATRRDWTGIRADLHEVYEMFPKLAALKKRLAGSLSGGEQQMVAIGRALMAQAAVPADGRTVGWPRAGDRRRHGRYDSRPQQARPHDPPGRAEHRRCRSRGRTCLHPSGWRDYLLGCCLTLGRQSRSAAVLPRSLVSLS